ncbi:hypothetical protein [Prevotellamassilia timonensis]|nr:hypothetical protein [Prevotellamassilia timonensis]MCF2635318.1 hypothetical protein [Prevotellamassilia timonensis]
METHRWTPQFSKATPLRHSSYTTVGRVACTQKSFFVRRRTLRCVGF